MPREQYDAIVVGSGPNGLAAAIALARSGLGVLVVEAAATVGGGTRTMELTAPGFHHDVCATAHPLGVASPYFQTLALEDAGVEWLHSAAPLAHVLGDGRAVMLERSIAATAAGLDRDGAAYRALFEPFVERWDELVPMLLGPARVPSAPVLMARFGLEALRSLRMLARRFHGFDAPALLAGIAAHAMVPLESFGTAAFALVLGGAAHASGWPVARGGSQAIADALVTRLREAGGEIHLGQRVTRLDELPKARAYVLDVTPRQVVAMAGDRLPPGYRHALGGFRYGPGVFKMDWALSGPVPWRDPQCARAATVHLAGTLDDISDAENVMHAGSMPERPYVLFAQAAVADPSRAPAGMHTAWAYCHVPHGSTVDASAAIEAQLERAAPGFRDLVLARASKTALDMQRYNENYIGGDINGGVSDLRQLFTRPLARLDPYSTPAPDVFLCSSSTPPGGGVHGMCGYWAARSVLKRVFGLPAPPLATPRLRR